LTGPAAGGEVDAHPAITGTRTDKILTPHDLKIVLTFNMQ
jgi:hypothetical protein